MNEADEEFDRARQKSQGRFRSAFEAIFKKYGQIDEEDDIIDLETGNFIVDNGRVRNSRTIELGDLLKYSDQPSRPSSPELFSNEQLEQRRSTDGRHQYKQYNHDDDETHGLDQNDLWQEDSDNGSGSIDLDFASYINQHEGASAHVAGIGSLWKRRRKTTNSDEDEDSVEYDSSDSMAADKETTPIDAYFTSSIEHYLDKLRQQLSTPRTTRDYSPSSTSHAYDSSHFDNHQHIHNSQTLRNYQIPSSPHTMTPRSSGNGTHAQSMASSPESSVYSDDYKVISESSIASSPRSYSPQPGTTSSEQQFKYEHETGAPVVNEWYNSIHTDHHRISYEIEEEEESDGPISEEEPIESLNLYRNSNQHYHFSNDSPEPSPFLLEQHNTDNSSSPVLRRPQPVAPHVFFSRDTSLDVASGFVTSPPNSKNRQYRPFQQQSTAYKHMDDGGLDSDDSASIHSGMSLDSGQHATDVITAAATQTSVIHNYHESYR